MYHDYSMEKIVADLKSPSKKNFILDTDTYNEIDDQFAIAYGMYADNTNVNDTVGLVDDAYDILSRLAVDGGDDVGHVLG